VTTRSFTPKLVTTLREGYSASFLRADAIAGLTVAIVALPLAMALGIASGASPDKGLITAVVAGFLISVLGGSRVQVGGPTGAFVVVIFNVIAKHGYDGLLVATLLAGIILILAGVFRLGQMIKFIPHPVVTGFTALPLPRFLPNSFPSGRPILLPSRPSAGRHWALAPARSRSSLFCASWLPNFRAF
jgi:SulP family sulfate permease